jgi:hypothetical protein
VSGSSSDHDYRLKGSLASAWKIAAGVGAVGIVAAMGLGASDGKRFAFSYLFAFVTFLTLSIGATFFVLLQHVTSAGWSATVRRTAEFLMSALPVFALLFVPVALHADDLYGSWMSHGEHAAPTGEHAAPAGGHAAPAGEHAAPAAGEHAAPAGHGAGPAAPGQRLTQAEIEHQIHSETIAKKGAYLTTGFFFGRALIYFLIWAFVALRMFGFSTSQDGSRDREWTRRMQGMAPWALPLMGLSSTFAAFDWYMSLLPAWYSTIFGVVMFASGMVALFATLTLVTMWLRDKGVFGDALTVEHYHDLGKLLFGFNCFWAYVSFSQFFLIWYAGIPEEAEFYHLRWSDGPWANVSVAIAILHFVVPFILLMSRNVKRSLGWLKVGAWLLAVMHVVEMYWLIMPNYAASMGIEAREAHALSPHALDLLSLVGVGGVYAAAVLYRMANHPIVAIGDPRFDRSRHFENA